MHSVVAIAKCIIGPLWFQEEGVTVTINQERYRKTSRVIATS